MAGEANPRRLGDLVNLVRGTTYSGMRLGEPGPVLLGLATIERNGGFRSDSLRTYGGDSPNKLLLKPGDLYVSLKDVTQSADLLGAVARVPDTVLSGRLTQDTVKLELKSHRLADLIYWTLRSPQYRAFCRAHATGTTNLGLPRDDFLSFLIPPLDAPRKALLALLGALDTKIELNRRMAETLEATARALFKSWFVDFDPVVAKVKGRSTGLADNIAALFPSQIGDDGLPVGWRREALRPNLTLSIVRGISPAYGDVGVPVVNQKCIRNGRLNIGKCRFHDPAIKRISPERQIKKGDVLVNSTGVGTLGRAAQVQSETELFTADSHVTIIKPNINLVSSNLFGLTLLGMQEAIEALGEGSTGQTELSRDAVGQLEIVVAGGEVQDAFDRLVSPLRERATLAVAESSSLTILRDTLLPQLISGELRICDAERVVAAA